MPIFLGFAHASRRPPLLAPFPQGASKGYIIRCRAILLNGTKEKEQNNNNKKGTLGLKVRRVHIGDLYQNETGGGEGWIAFVFLLCWGTRKENRQEYVFWIFLLRVLLIKRTADGIQRTFVLKLAVI